MIGVIAWMRRHLFRPRPPAGPHRPLRGPWGSSVYCAHGNVANRCPKAASVYYEGKG